MNLTGRGPLGLTRPKPERAKKKGLPLCLRHHRREFGSGAYHYSPKAFYAAHGPLKELLETVREMLDAR